MWFKRKHKPKQVMRPVRLVKARFDAAATNADNTRHWANADGLSANAAASPEIRRILRNRAHYEVANNSYARGIVTTLANDVIGTGPRLQLLTEDNQGNRDVETAFSEWAGEIRLAQKLRTMRMARATDGEAFAILAINQNLASPVKLDLKLVEADQITTPWSKANKLNDNNVDGIKFDSFGNPAAYYVLREHPGTTYSEFKREILNEIARCLNMPYNIAAGNSSGYNYASGRLDHQTYFKSIRVDQADLALVVLDRILQTWMHEAILISDFIPITWRMLRNYPHQWFWDGHEHVDPAKEAQAQATRLQNNTTTLATEYARVGLDWETELRQRAKEKQLMEELGLNPVIEKAPVKPQQTTL